MAVVVRWLSARCRPTTVVHMVSPITAGNWAWRHASAGKRCASDACFVGGLCRAVQTAEGEYHSSQHADVAHDDSKYGATALTLTAYHHPHCISPRQSGCSCHRNSFEVVFSACTHIHTHTPHSQQQCSSGLKRAHTRTAQPAAVFKWSQTRARTHTHTHTHTPHSQQQRSGGLKRAHTQTPHSQQQCSGGLKPRTHKHRTASSTVFKRSHIRAHTHTAQPAAVFKWF